MMMTRQALILLLARSWSGLQGNNNTFLPSASALVLVPPHGHRQGQRGFPSRLPSRPSPSHSYASSSVALLAKPKKAGSTVDNYQTVSVNCSKCQQRLFRYKKKNGTKSNLVKCYIERISEDSAGVLALAAASHEAIQSASPSTSVTTTDKNNKNNTKKRKRKQTQNSNSNSYAPNPPLPEESTTSTKIPTQLDPSYSWECPSCHTQFARSSLIHGRPALKLVGGKIRMTKK